MEVLGRAKTCAHCGVRFDTSKTKKRKRQLNAQPGIVLKLNNERKLVGKPLLSQNDIVCHACLSKYEYRLTKGTTTNDSSSEDAASESGSQNEMSIDVSQGDSEPSIAQDAEPIAGPSSYVQSGNAPTHCDQCRMDFAMNPNLQIRSLNAHNGLLFYINQILQAGMKSPFQSTNFLCNSCYLPYYTAYTYIVAENARQLQRNDEEQAMQYSGQQDTSSDSASSVDSSESRASPKAKRVARSFDEILLPITSVSQTVVGCFICKRAKGRKTVKKCARIQVWIQHQIYIKRDMRICSHHIDSESLLFKPESIKWILELPRHEKTHLKAKEITDFLKDVTEYADLKHKRGRLSFSKGGEYSEEDFMQFFGLSKSQFNELHKLVEPFLRNSSLRSTEDAVAIFLMKLRTNASHRLLGCLFNMSIFLVSRAIKTVREKLVHVFVPKHLGYSHVPRNAYISQHTTDIAKKLTGATDAQCIVVVDGTYLYIQKSSNYKAKRQTYSPHKYRNLLKAMMLVSTTGHILHVDGPYLADGGNNDANIMKNMTRDFEGFRQYFKTGDFIIEDRGFRDCNELLTSLGYSVKMPHFLGPKRKQHTAMEANESRLVTKIRWIVESVNGRIKNVFRFFRDVIPNSYLKNNVIWDFLKISCALLNAFHPPLKVDTPEDAEYAEVFLQRLEMENLLQARLKDANLIRRTKEWKEVDVNTVHDFPRLSLTDIRRFTLGVYQLKQAPSYLAANENEEGDYDLFWHEELGYSAVRFFLKSRFRGSKVHSCWVGFNLKDEGWKSITGWYCLCESGSRIIGCCAHVAAVVWYLGYARYLSKIKAPGKGILKDVRDAASFEYEEESLDIDDDDDEIIDQEEEDAA